MLDGTQDPNPFFGRVVYTVGLTLDQPLALTRYGYTDYVTATNSAGRTASIALSVPDLWFLYGNVLDDQLTGTGTQYLYGFAGSNPANFADPFGLCPIEKPLCHWIKAALMAAGTDLGFIAGGGAGLLTGPAAIAASPAGALAGAATGAAAGAAIGQAVDNIFFSKRDIKQVEDVARRFRMGKEDRREFGKFVEAEKAAGRGGTANERGDFKFRELVQKAREFLGLDP